MILEADEETRDFVTIYKKDFEPKRTKKLSKIIQPPSYKPPLSALNGPFHEHLNSLRKNERVPPQERTEDLNDNLKRVRAKYPELVKELPETPPDENVIEAEQKKKFKTIYQLEYSREDLGNVDFLAKLNDLAYWRLTDDFLSTDDYISLHAKRTGGDRPPVTLPDGWLIPETIYKGSYRNPGDSGALELLRGSHKIGKPPNNLDPNEKERDLRRVVTGISEYGDVIGGTGDRIFKKQLHGMPPPLDPPLPRLKGPDSIRSECSIVLMSRRPDENI